MSVGKLLKTILKDLLVYWKILVIIIAPFALLPLPILLPDPAAYCGYVILLMTIYWITEVLPLAVTALLPLLLLPVFGLVPGRTVAGLYIADTTIVFMTGLMLALAIEKWNLHKRIGLGILVLLGPSRVLIGFMLPTWFLSMWMSNTATTAMMIPVAEAVIVQMTEGVHKRRRERLAASKKSVIQMQESNGFGPHKESEYNEGFVNEEKFESTYFGHEGVVLSPVDLIKIPEVTREDVDYDGKADEEAATEVDMNEEAATEVDMNEEAATEAHEEAWLKNFAKMMCLAIAYSSNVGGTATLNGSATNPVVSQAIEKIWESHGLKSPLTYSTWMLFGLPHAILCLIITWAWLQLIFMGWRSFCFCCVKENVVQNEDEVKDMLRKEYDTLGSVSFAEISIIILLVSMVALWFGRDPGFAEGYASFFKPGYVTDAAPAIFIATLLFFWPSRRPNWLCFRPTGEKATTVPPLLDWKTVSSKLAWGPVILIGGGFALARACDDSGLSRVIGEELAELRVIPTWAIAIIVAVMVAFFTEITSNVAVVSLLLPILEAMSNDLGINPMYLMMTAGMAASYAFMLPIATPPNAIVFSYGHLKIVHMASVGFFMNFLCVLVVFLGINTWGMALFDMKHIPWLLDDDFNNITTSSFKSI